jgi:tetratricopeptide (TPR) repeat protein
MGDFGVELQRLMTARGIGVRELARRVPCNPGHISNLRRDKKQASPELVARIDDVLGARGKLAALAASGSSRRDVLKVGLVAVVTAEMLEAAAADALEFTRLAGVSAVGPGVLSHLEAVIAGLDRAYSKQAPTGLFPAAHAYRARVEELMGGPCTLREKRDLYICAAWLSEALAWLAHDLGSPVTAEAYAIDAYEHAVQAGHDELCAWAADALASIALYTNRPQHALAVARKGVAKAPTRHPLAVRMRAQVARAHARLGQREECEQALTEAGQLYERLPARSPERSGIDTGVLASYAVTAYPASCYVWLGDFEKAERYGRDAVAAHENAPSGSRSPSREAIARIDLGMALAGGGVPDEAAALGCQALGSGRVVDSVRTRAGDLDTMLMGRYPTHETVRTFHEQYRAMTTPRLALTGAE